MSATSKLEGLRILVVEDNYFIASEIAGELSSRGAEVVGPLGALQDALDLVSAGEPLDVAVLDVDIQGRKVFPVADGLIERNVPFIFCTGYDDVMIPERYAAYPLRLKPIDYDQLADLLTSRRS
jgi:CheY-like chemotaxis protein